MSSDAELSRDRTAFGQRLLAARKHAGLTQVDLGKQSGLGQSGIAYLETKGNASEQTVLLAEVCGVRAAWLARGEGPMLGPESDFERATAVAREAIPEYLEPNAAQDYRTIVHTLARSLDSTGVTLSIKQFLALADEVHRKFGGK